MFGLVCVQENPTHDPLQLDRVLLEGGDHPLLAALGSRDDEMQCQQCFPDAGRTSDDRRGAPPVAVDEHAVQRRYPGGHPLGVTAVVARVHRIGEPRKDVESVGGKPVRVLSGLVPAPAKLPHLQDPHLPLGRAIGSQGDDRVRNRELGCLRGLLTVVLAHPERGHRHRRQHARQLMQEHAERSVVLLVSAQRLEAVDDHQAGTALLEQLADTGQHTGQSLFVEDVTEVLVEHPVAERGTVEVLERLAEPQQFVQWLGDRRQVQRGLGAGGVVEHVLLGKDRLARSRKAAQQGDHVERKSAAEYRIQPGRTARESIAHRMVAG